jgi:hypothetical protein
MLTIFAGIIGMIGNLVIAGETSLSGLFIFLVLLFFIILAEGIKKK